MTSDGDVNTADGPTAVEEPTAPDRPGAVEEPVAELIARWSAEEPDGLMVQTTHWRRIAFSSAVYLGGLCSWIAYVAIGGFAPEGAPLSERIQQLVLVTVGFLPAMAWWRFVRSRTGVVVRPDGLVARRVFRADLPLDRSAPPDSVLVSSWGGRTAVGGNHGFSLPGSYRRALPGMRAYSKSMTELRSCRLILMPARPWYRPAARYAVPRRIVWRAGTDGRDVLGALGFEPPPEPAAEPSVGRARETAAKRLERWNRAA